MIYYLAFRILEILLLVSIVVVPIIAFVFILLRFKKCYSKLYILGLLGIALVYFNKLFLGYALAQPDFNRFLVPFFNFFGQSLRRFSAPLWNPHFGYGFDNWRIFTAPFFGPFAFLSAFFGVYKFLGIYMIIQHFVLLLGGFVFGKTLKMEDYKAFAFAIFWAFNGWVCMRFNQGVGYEYLISYKWLPWALASAYYLLRDRNIRNVLLFGLCIGFLFEGTPNVGILGTLLVSVYFLLESGIGDLVKTVYCLVSVYLVAALFFLPRILPALLAQSTVSYSTRLVWEASGWRANLISIKDFPKYFLPFNGNGVAERGFFTPGMFGALLMLFFVVGVFIEIVGNRFKYRNFVFLAIFVVGVVLSTESWLSSNFWQFPILRRVTRIPASLMFITTAVPYFMVSGFGYLIGVLGGVIRFVKYGKRFFWIACGLAVFFEVLVGVKFFGIESYTFDFLKFKPKVEVATFGYLDGVGALPAYALSPADMVMPMYVSSIRGIESLNAIHYFLGNVLIGETMSRDLDKGVLLYNPKVVVSVRDVNSAYLDLENIYMVDDYTHRERSYQMDRVKLVGKWDGGIRVYKNINYASNWRNVSNRPNEFIMGAHYIFEKDGVLPLSFSPYWVSVQGAKLSRDSVSGLTKVTRFGGEKVHLLYFPWFVYASFFLTDTAILTLFVFRKRFIV